MVDLKYGLYKLIFWLPIMIIFPFLEYSTSGWLQTSIYLLVAAIFLVVVLFLRKNILLLKKRIAKQL